MYDNYSEKPKNNLKKLQRAKIVSKFVEQTH